MIFGWANKLISNDDDDDLECEMFLDSNWIGGNQSARLNEWMATMTTTTTTTKAAFEPPKEREKFEINRRSLQAAAWLGVKSRRCSSICRISKSNQMTSTMLVVVLVGVI